MTRRADEKGAALVSALLVLMLMSAMLAGFLVMVNADQMAGGVNRDQTQAYAAAHAGVEKLTADLGQVFTANYSPNEADIEALTTDEPDLQGITYDGPNGTPGYRITFLDADEDGNPDVEDPLGSRIEAGQFEGLRGLITPYTIDVTARTTGGAEVRMRRTMQSVAIPVFQFGIFSENNLSFHANGYYSFGGRVHSNQNIFLSSVDGTQAGVLTLADRVTAVEEIVRKYFANGRSTEAAGYTGTIRMAKAAGCPAAPAAATSACRNLAMSEGSVTGDVGSSPTPNWSTLANNDYNEYISNGLTGAKRLDLPIVDPETGMTAIEIIRRPTAAEPVSVASQRFYNLASLRILLADTAAELTALPGVVGTPVSLEAATAGGWNLATAGSSANGYRSPSGTRLIGGVILINKQDTDGDWTDVTNEILTLGITGRDISDGSCTDPHPNAIIRLQRVKDSAACNSTTATDIWPNTLYDAREGLTRDIANNPVTNVYLGGVMHYVEFDVDNYREWLTGVIPGSGAGSQNLTGYVVYFSDRRNNKNAANTSTGEYGWEDFVYTNNALDTGEDVNGSGGNVEQYGNVPRFLKADNSTFTGSSPLDGNARVTTTVTATIARANRAVFFRRALKLVNGGLNQLPSNGLQGLTVASENPVYVQGNFNACGLPTAACASNGFGPTGDNHRSAAIIADAVTLLSRAWNDRNSFTPAPHDATYSSGTDDRDAETTWYRMGIISGKGLNFPWPAGTFANFGSDGGAHNFLRFLEDWSGRTVNYRGSMVSLYTSRQAVGTWKCQCEDVYIPPARNAFFDEEFLIPALLPPRTPMFRDINTLTFRQILRPTQ